MDVRETLLCSTLLPIDPSYCSHYQACIIILIIFDGLSSSFETLCCRCVCIVLFFSYTYLGHISHDGFTSLLPGSLYFMYSPITRFLLIITFCTWFVCHLPLRIISMSLHYSDVIMGAMSSLITSLTSVYSTVHSCADKENIKAPRHWPLCGEFTRDRWIPRTNGQ